MKAGLLLAAAIIGLTACGSSLRVTTTVAPGASFTGLHKFRILTPPARRDGRRMLDDPMLVNSITNQVLLTNITDAFIGRGYALDPTTPDFTVAYYASVRETLDVTLWDYGYPGRWGGWYSRPGYATAVPYAEGTIIIDVIDPKTNELLWRGRGQSATSDNPADFQKDLRDAVQAIVRQFPPAVTHVAANP